MVVFTVLGFAMLPWTIWLASSLNPHHVTHRWDLAWSGFDSVLAVSFLLTAFAAWHRRPWLPAAAAATGALLVADAWFDIVLESRSNDLEVAVMEACLAEVPLRNASRALYDAVAQQNVALVHLLLECGADASTIGPGRWVLHPDLAPMLASVGASVGRSGSWIGLACTGNQGRKDDPAYVEALLRYGARVTDRRLIGQSNDGGHATALHYAVKAGFVETIRVLLGHGADSNARDDNGLTPLDWLERSTKSVDRQTVSHLLRGG